MTNPTASSSFPLPHFWHCPCILSWHEQQPRIFSSWFPHKKPSSHLKAFQLPGGGYVLVRRFRVPLWILPGNHRRLGGRSCWFDVSSEPIESEERVKTRFYYQGDQQFSRVQRSLSQQTGDQSQFLILLNSRFKLVMFACCFA